MLACVGLYSASFIGLTGHVRLLPGQDRDTSAMLGTPQPELPRQRTDRELLFMGFWGKVAPLLPFYPRFHCLD